MLRERDLSLIMFKAGESMEQDGNLDINMAANQLRTAAERFYYLLKYPDNRPMQERIELLHCTG